MPGLDAPPLFPHIDKFFHMGEYMPFGALFARAIHFTKPTLGSKVLIGLGLAGAFFYGITDEWHQSFVEGRSSSVLDVMFDALGGFLGALIYVKLFKQR